jgi:small subunit ribosomal protein S15
MKKNRKDKSCLRSLLQLVQRRTKLLKYLKETDTDKYYDILKELGLREPVVQKYLQKQGKKK